MEFNQAVTIAGTQATAKEEFTKKFEAEFQPRPEEAVIRVLERCDHKIALSSSTTSSRRRRGSSAPKHTCRIETNISRYDLQENVKARSWEQCAERGSARCQEEANDQYGGTFDFGCNVAWVAGPDELRKTLMLQDATEKGFAIEQFRLLNCTPDCIEATAETTKKSLEWLRGNR